jgi:hypothetical protein
MHVKEALYNISIACIYIIMCQTLRNIKGSNKREWGLCQKHVEVSCYLTIIKNTPLMTLYCDRSGFDARE